MNNAFQRFASNLRFVRRRANLTQAQLAAKLGLSASTIRDWEAGRGSPRWYHQEKLREVFGDTALIDLEWTREYLESEQKV